MQQQKATLTDKVSTQSAGMPRLFVAAEVPDEIKILLNEKLRQYTTYIKRLVNQNNWPMTFLYIGRVNDFESHQEVLGRDLSQAFLPTITLTHLGRGCQPDQLWVYAKPTALLQTIKQQLLQRVEGQIPNVSQTNQPEMFVPHIKLADLRDRSISKFVADSPLLVTWPVKKLFLFNSTVYLGETKYDIKGTIDL
jgi:2'-5' RNA ligase